MRSLPLVAFILSGMTALSIDAGLKDCRWLDRYLSRSGCIAHYSLPDLSSLGSTMAIDGEGLLMVVGVDYRTGPQESARVAGVPQLVTLDLSSGRVNGRVDLPFNGTPDQMRVSPQDRKIVLACNTIYVCDLADRPQTSADMGATQFGVFDRDGSLQWSHAVPRNIVQPSAEGRAFDLAVSLDGAVILAGPMAFAAEDGAVSEDTMPESDATNATIDTTRNVLIAGEMTDLDLPADFVPFTRLQTAHSADGHHLATLSRRFSGAGEIRALLQIWDRTTGERRARYKVRTDLSPALAFSDDGQSSLVAVAQPPEVGAGTVIRAYSAEAS